VADAVKFMLLCMVDNPAPIKILILSIEHNEKISACVMTCPGGKLEFLNLEKSARETRSQMREYGCRTLVRRPLKIALMLATPANHFEIKACWLVWTGLRRSKTESELEMAPHRLSETTEELFPPEFGLRHVGISAQLPAAPRAVRDNTNTKPYEGTGKTGHAW
jgi:hypothetical protein